MIGDLSNNEPNRVAFLMVPNFSMISFSSAIGPLRMANQLSGSGLYEWITVSANGEPVTCSNGITLSTDRSINDRERYDAVFVCGGNNIHLTEDDSMLNWLHALGKQKVTLGAVCTGSYLLAKAVLLDGYRSTIQWENKASSRERYPPSGDLSRAL